MPKFVLNQSDFGSENALTAHSLTNAPQSVPRVPSRREESSSSAKMSSRLNDYQGPIYFEQFLHIFKLHWGSFLSHPQLFYKSKGYMYLFSIFISKISILSIAERSTQFCFLVSYRNVITFSPQKAGYIWIRNNRSQINKGNNSQYIAS